MVRTVDAVLVNDEFEMVQFRKKYLSATVHCHFLGESRTTFSGKQKALYFREHKKLFPHEYENIEIIEIPGFAGQVGITSFERENLQRDYFAEAVCKTLPPETVIFFGDVDEVPSKSQVRFAQESLGQDGCLSVPMVYSYRRANWLKKRPPGSGISANFLGESILKVVCGGWNLIRAGVFPACTYRT